MKKFTLLAVLLPAVIAFLAFFPVKNKNHAFHTEAELAYFRQHKLNQDGAQPWTVARAPGTVHNIPIDSNILFPTSKTCGGCHGHDPNNYALLTPEGEDVNQYDAWRATMMAQSARDPFWRAKVTHEMMVNPAHSEVLQDKCTSCHAPAGHYQAKLKEHQEYYTLANLYADTLGLDGVTCQACHAQSPQNIGNFHSGQLNFDTSKIRVAYGPFEFVFAPPMHEFVGITPLYSDHILDAGLCAGCHTLITNSVDEAGEPTGSTFVEQATYHEWLNSRYDEETDNVTCQGCHVPQIADAVVLSANYQFLTPKFPFGKHELAGANVTMLRLMKANRQQLGIGDIAPALFDSTIAATLRMLQQNSVDLTLEPGIVHGDSIHFKLRLLNKAGHKFPSGYPSRRAWVEFEVKDQSGAVVFHSGRFDPNDFSLPDEDANFEPHYDLIDRPDQVQVYELVPGDVSGLFTNVLERAHQALKDNRLTPQGFSTTDPVYDTTRIAGSALTDPDFNRSSAGVQGTGADLLHFRIANAGYSGFLTATARVWYQSLPPKWMAPMFEFSSPEIDSFKVMFDAADRAPILVAEEVLDSVYVSTVSTKPAAETAAIRVFPSLSADGRVRIQVPSGLTVQRVEVWNSAGKLVLKQAGAGPLQLPEQRGTYYVAVVTRQGRVVERVVRL
jgi:hypothetical protein